MFGFSLLCVCHSILEINSLLQARESKSCLSKNSLAVFDKFAAAQQGDPREKQLSGAALEDLVGKLKEAEPFLTTTKAILTSTDRMDATAVNIMEGYYATIDDLFEAHPELDREPTRIMNFDEAGLNNRGEFEKKDMTVFVTKELLKALRGLAPVRVMALNDGSGNVTMVPFVLGGAIRLATAFIGPVCEKQVKEDWSAPASWTEPARSGIPFPPGIHREHFQREDIKIFATESGSNNKELIAHMLMTWIIPLWRRLHPTGPLVILQDAPHCHGWSEELCQFCADNNIFIVKFPHNSTTMTQCLDVWFFKAFRRLYRKACENLRAAWEFKHGFLDMQMECCFRK